MLKQGRVLLVLLAFMATTVTGAQAQTITDIVASSGGEFDGNRYDFDILLNAVLTAGRSSTRATPRTARRPSRWAGRTPSTAWVTTRKR